MMLIQLLDEMDVSVMMDVAKNNHPHQKEQTAVFMTSVELILAILP